MRLARGEEAGDESQQARKKPRMSTGDKSRAEILQETYAGTVRQLRLLSEQLASMPDSMMHDEAALLSFQKSLTGHRNTVKDFGPANCSMCLNRATRDSDSGRLSGLWLVPSSTLSF